MSKCCICGKSILFPGQKLNDGNCICGGCSQNVPNIIRNPQSGKDVETAKAIISYFTDEIKKYNDVFEETEHYGKLHLDSVHGLIAICDDTNVSNTGRLKREINEIFNVLYLSEISSSKQQTNVNSSRAVCDIFYHFSFTQPCVSFNICIKKGAVIKCEMLDDTHVSYSDPTDKMFFDSIFNDMISRTKEKYIKAINEMNEKIQAKKRAEEEAQRRAKEENKRREAAFEEKRNSQLKEAEIMFMLDGEYTLEDVKKQRNRMLKAFHPDNDSSIDSKYGEKINACYEVLLNEIKKRSQI